MQSLKQIKFNPINFGLAVIVLAGLAYVGWALTHSQSTPASKDYPESKLVLRLGPGASPGNLSADLKVAQAAIAREDQDNGAANQIAASTRPGNSAKTLISWTELARREVEVCAFISPLAGARLSSALNSLRSALDSLSKTAGSITRTKPADRYALLVPRVAEIKVADDQQAAASLLAQLSALLGQAVEQSGIHGVAATDFEADLTTLGGDVSAAANLSAKSESGLTGGTTSGQIKADLTATKLDIAAAQNAAATVISGL